MNKVFCDICGSETSRDMKIIITDLRFKYSKTPTITKDLCRKCLDKVMETLNIKPYVDDFGHP